MITLVYVPKTKSLSRFSTNVSFLKDYAKVDWSYREAEDTSNIIADLDGQLQFDAFYATLGKAEWDGSAQGFGVSQKYVQLRENKLEVFRGSELIDSMQISEEMPYLLIDYTGVSLIQPTDMVQLKGFYKSHGRFRLYLTRIESS
jgi:hypothetical protein